jgi:hypothetical protein
MDGVGSVVAVTAAANIYGIPLGNRLYGQEDSQVTFRIGDARVDRR